MTGGIESPGGAVHPEVERSRPLSPAIFALVVGWCTSQTECWSAPAAADPGYATMGACREALPAEARAALLPHFRDHHLDVRLSCERRRIGTAEQAADRPIE